MCFTVRNCSEIWRIMWGNPIVFPLETESWSPLYSYTQHRGIRCLLLNSIFLWLDSWCIRGMRTVKSKKLLPSNKSVIHYLNKPIKYKAGAWQNTIMQNASFLLNDGSMSTKNNATCESKRSPETGELAGGHKVMHNCRVRFKFHQVYRSLFT